MEGGLLFGQHQEREIVAFTVSSRLVSEVFKYSFGQEVLRLLARLCRNCLSSSWTQLGCNMTLLHARRNAIRDIFRVFDGGLGIIVGTVEMTDFVFSDTFDLLPFRQESVRGNVFRTRNKTSP